MKTYDQLSINGQWTKPSGGTSMDVVNASTEQVMGRICMGDDNDVNAGVQAARAAFTTWSQTSAAERAQWAGGHQWRRLQYPGALWWLQTIGEWTRARQVRA